ncbi:glycosyltransferase family 4 protein [Candidatus Pacearchaeota archaeon]|nr:glycosyltransferase family 4 protein [Candidatus Pacearchaeota archaeon]
MKLLAEAATGISGYGRVGNDFIKLLYSKYTKDIELITEDVHWGVNCHHPELKPLMLKLMRNKISKPDLKYILWTPKYHVHTDIPTVLETMYETDFVPSNWISKCNDVNRTWVPSKFCESVFKKSGVDNVKYMPFGIDFAEPNTIAQITDDDRFSFLIVNQWSERKFAKQTVQTFCETFSAKDNVVLYIRTDAPFGLESIGIDKSTPYNDIMEIKAKIVDSPQIIMLDAMDVDTLNRVYSSVDCILNSVRGEGVGRSAIEAMAMGTPSIATNWSSLPEFINDKNGFLVDYKLTNINVPALEQDLYYFEKHMSWAEPDITHLSTLMNYALDHPEEIKRKGARASKDVRKQFDWNTLLQNRITDMEYII